MAKASEEAKSGGGQDELLKQLIALIDGGQAHATFEDAVKDFPAKMRGAVPEGLPYSAWQILEHIRIAQQDILNFSAPPTGGYHGMKWPEAYWPTDAGAAIGKGVGGSDRCGACRPGEVQGAAEEAKA